jgi:hypothetical protein
MAREKRVDGNRLFYHYLQKDLLESDIWLFQMFVSRLVVSLGVWLHPQTYERLPIILPYAVRDPLSRGSKRQGIPDRWGAPNSDGRFKDDNSLVKGLPRSLTILSGKSRVYERAMLGKGFVAAHVWRQLASDELASRNPLTYSFVPNLVWLPSEVAALTDRDRSFVQTFTQALAVKIYRDRVVAEAQRKLAEQAWELLPFDAGLIPRQGLPEVADLNFFEPNAAWLTRRIQAIRDVADALQLAASGVALTKKVISSRYTEGISTLSVSTALALADDLRRHVPSPEMN